MWYHFVFLVIYADWKTWSYYSKKLSPQNRKNQPCLLEFKLLTECKLMTASQIALKVPLFFSYFCLEMIKSKKAKNSLRHRYTWNGNKVPSVVGTSKMFSFISWYSGIEYCFRSSNCYFSLSAKTSSKWVCHFHLSIQYREMFHTVIVGVNVHLAINLIWKNFNLLLLIFF